jgi:hypothetical protein
MPQAVSGVVICQRYQGTGEPESLPGEEGDIYLNPMNMVPALQLLQTLKEKSASGYNKYKNGVLVANMLNSSLF